MLSTRQFCLLCGLAFLVLLDVVLNMVLYQRNAQLQGEVAERQLYVQQTVQLERLYREMVKTLAELSTRNNDERLKELLVAQEITITIDPPAPVSGLVKIR